MRLVVLIGILIMCPCSWALAGDNVCPETERYLVNVTRSVVKTVQVRHYKWCMNVPPRCSFYTEEERLVPEIVEEEQLRIVHKCCPGYDEDEENKTCVSQCAKCKHGQCEFNTCICDPGYHGDDCDKVCPKSFWGKNCENTCTCKHGECDPESGRCACNSGWTGESCNKELSTTFKTEYTTTLPGTTTASSSGHLDQILLTTDRSKHPTLQKYYTFFITTQKPLFSNTSDTKTTIVKVSATSNGKLTGITTLVNSNITKTTQISVPDYTSTVKETTQKPQFSNVTRIVVKDNLENNRKVVGDSETNANYPTFSHTDDNNWIHNGTDVDVKNDLVIHYDQSPHLLFSVGAVIGVTATIVFMVAALYVTRIYVKQKPASVISVVAKSSKSNDGNGVCIYTSSVFHSPLPDPPTFDNPIFTTPIDIEANPTDFGSTVHTQVIYSMQVPTYSTFKKDSSNINTFYDHPPSTGSYRAASIPELPSPEQCGSTSNCAEQKEHLYDEIPCWKQSVSTRDDDSTNILLSYYENCKDIN